MNKEDLRQLQMLEQAMLIQKKIANGRYIEMYTDEALHSEVAAQHIIDFLLEK